MSGMAFIEGLSYGDHMRLRKIVRNVHMRHYPSQHMNDQEADKLIESIGIEAGENLLRKAVNRGMVE